MKEQRALTVGDLKEQLRGVDDTTVVVIATCGFPRGIFPAADAAAIAELTYRGANRRVLILRPGSHDLGGNAR